MNRKFATLLLGFFSLSSALSAATLSYDYFRGLPDGSWNGNNGVVISENIGFSLPYCLNAQAGGSYGVYNWDGRGNLVFSNPKSTEQIGFVTAGISSSFNRWAAGLVYDRLFTKHFGIYDKSPSIDQLRFQGGYTFCAEEVGLWATAYLTQKNTHALGVPVSFRAINQVNLFWTHTFHNHAKTTLWAGLPYTKSLMGHAAGTFTAGFCIRAPLTERLSVEGRASYMMARTSHGVSQSQNYASNICVGVNYSFWRACQEESYMPLANHSNFLVDTNTNE